MKGCRFSRFIAAVLALIIGAAGWMWYSTDCGKTWVQTSKVAEGGITRLGVWEPFTFYEDGKLYCFYSDDSDPLHDQKLVFKWSEDGLNWSDAIDVCTFKNAADRPGMAVLTKMGKGRAGED